MKTQELLLASFVVAAVAGVGASLVTRSFVDHPARADAGPREAPASPAASVAAPGDQVARAMDDLRMENVALNSRVATLEARLAEALTQRVAVAAPAADGSGDLMTDESGARIRDDGGIVVTSAFVDSVGQALETIRAKEEAERQAKRKELQAQRIEERLTRLQEDLGLSNRQVSDVRTVLLTMDEKREQLMGSAFNNFNQGGRDARDGEADRRAFRDLRDEAYASLQTILTPAQLESYRKSEEADFRRRGPDFGGQPRPDGQPAPAPQGGQRGR